MKIEIDDKIIESILRLEISYKLNGLENIEKFDNKITGILESKIEDYIKSESFEEIVKNIISNNFKNTN